MFAERGGRIIGSKCLGSSVLVNVQQMALEVERWRGRLCSLLTGVNILTMTD